MKWEDQRGFTLIEVMITVAIVILVLVGYVGANTVIQQRNEANFERAVAIQDANQVIEQMRRISQTGEFPGNVISEFPHNQLVGGFENLSGQQVVISYLDPTADPLNVTVTVSWLEGGQRAVDIALRTLLTQRTT